MTLSQPITGDLTAGAERAAPSPARRAGGPALGNPWGWGWGRSGRAAPTCCQAGGGGPRPASCPPSPAAQRRRRTTPRPCRVGGSFDTPQPGSSPGEGRGVTKEGGAASPPPPSHSQSRKARAKASLLHPLAGPGPGPVWAHPALGSPGCSLGDTTRAPHPGGGCQPALLVAGRG